MKVSLSFKYIPNNYCIIISFVHKKHYYIIFYDLKPKLLGTTILYTINYNILLDKCFKIII